MSVFELASLQGLRRLSLVRVHKLTDMAVYALAEQAMLLERLHLSYCDRLSLESIHVLMRKLEHLHHLSVTGVPSLKRKGTRRFSALPPSVCFPSSIQLPVFNIWYRALIRTSKLFTECLQVITLHC